MGDTAVSVSHLYKDFKLPHERKSTIKEWVLHFKKPTYEKLHALHDINLEIKRGEFFGIVGRNGSGKSTLLKIIGGIYQPTRGEVKVNGTLTPFIELGIGFNPELTGRENVFLNGAILGLTRKEIKQKYDEIVDFAELDRFMDQKLKNYSSGMQVRLAFSIAIQAHNDILLIDEVLAVGDAAFQRKCYQVFKDIKKSGKTVIFVTHDMGAVQEYCDRAMMIQDSKALIIGSPRSVALRYEVANTGGNEHLGSQVRPQNPAVKLKSVKLGNGKAQTQSFGHSDDIEVELEFDVAKALADDLQFNFYLVKPDGMYLAGSNSVLDLGRYRPAPGRHKLRTTIKAGQLPKNEYRFGIGVYTFDEPASLIDVLDTSYGVKMPKINVVERSKTQNGEFNMAAKWSQEKSS